jgi:hypothetical protein
MDRGSLRHDVALVMAKHLLAVVAPCLREEERGDALLEFLGIVDAGLERYEARLTECDRLKPGVN